MVQQLVTFMRQRSICFHKQVKKKWLIISDATDFKRLKNFFNCIILLQVQKKKAQIISTGLLSTNYSHNFSSTLLCVSQCDTYRRNNEPFFNIG